MYHLPFNLIRYLFAVRINSTLAWLPKFPSIELSIALGSSIADRLPSAQASQWIKKLSAWEQYGGIKNIISSNSNQIPENPWPIEAVLFVYPVKRSFIQGELFFFEIKLIGKDAEHEMFLEVILPAIEELGTNLNSGWQHPNSIWGHFDVDSVFVSKGSEWLPLVEQGKLDLQMPVSPSQWKENLIFKNIPNTSFNNIKWVMPFCLDCEINDEDDNNDSNSPTLKNIIDNFTYRMGKIIYGKYSTSDNFWDKLSDEDMTTLCDAVVETATISISKNNLINSQCIQNTIIGTQTFIPQIPGKIFPYLEMASIFHIGKYTHFGCGTFIVT